MQLHKTFYYDLFHSPYNYEINRNRPNGLKITWLYSFNGMNESSKVGSITFRCQLPFLTYSLPTHVTFILQHTWCVSHWNSTSLRYFILYPLNMIKATTLEEYILDEINRIISTNLFLNWDYLSFKLVTKYCNTILRKLTKNRFNIKWNKLNSK